MGAVAAARALRSFARAVTLVCLAGLGVPYSLFLFAVCGLSAPASLSAAQYWRVSLRRHWRLCVFQGALFVVSMFLLDRGTRAAGVARSVVLADYGGDALELIMRAMGSRAPSSPRTNTAVLALVSSLGILLFFDIPGFTSGSAGLCLLGVGVCSLLRQWAYNATVGKSAPGVERGVRFLSHLFSLVLLAPSAIAAFFSQPGLLFSPWVLMAVIVSAAALVVEMGVDGAMKQQMSQQLWIQTGLVAAFFSACASQLIFLNGVSLLSLIAFALMLGGVQTLSSEDLSRQQQDLDLPIVTGGAPSRATLVRNAASTAELVRNGFRQVLEHRKSRRLFAFLCVNLGFMFVEIIWGLWTNSLGLISDGCHMLFDCVALAIGLAAAVISKWEANQGFSYGYGRMQVLSGFVNGVLLVFIAFFVFAESMHRFFDEAEMKAEKLFIVSFLGFCVNIFGVFSFHQHGGEECDHHHGGDHDHHDHEHHEHDFSRSSARRSKWNEKRKGEKHHHRDENLHGVFLHVLADTLGSVGVIISSLLVEYYGLSLADPICSLCISLLIFVSVIPLLKSSATVLLQCTPAPVLEQLPSMAGKILAVEGVTACREIHCWKHSSTITVGTVSVNLAEDANEQRVLSMIQGILRENGVTHPCVECVKDPNNLLVPSQPQAPLH